MAGANPIIAVDLDDAKLEFAHRFGATHMINAGKSDPVAAIHALTPGKGEFTILETPVSGADFAFDCIGIKKTMEQIVPACRSATSAFVPAAPRYWSACRPRRSS